MSVTEGLFRGYEPALGAFPGARSSQHEHHARRHSGWSTRVALFLLLPAPDREERGDPHDTGQKYGGEHRALVAVLSERRHGHGRMVCMSDVLAVVKALSVLFGFITLDGLQRGGRQQ